ncbi:hypothetical protein [Streptomyces varsoviensis]|uniref:Uncharacterized protein n=1 Tax=Streptomyces varsoviensis TaxID=67373 RepID=A0ABR5JA93_9ACTN|nr:hypothetical protein [Streptomyces varsoviensis]KOG90363.1 hypothetical protein ADK38_09195 [Streptomyces varsoviensis]
MPLIPEEPQIHESVPGPRATPAAGRTAPTPRPVPGPGPRPAPKRPGVPGPSRSSATAPSQRTPRDAAVNAPAAEDAAASRPAAPAVSDAATSASATPQIQLIPAAADGALDAADEAVDLLLDSGRAPGEILVLTTGDPHPWAAHELSFGEASYWAQHDAGDDVFYALAAAERAKGRPVVVVAVNGGADEAVSAALPTAMARAGVLLIICGDPQRINAVISTSV